MNILRIISCFPPLFAIIFCHAQSMSLKNFEITTVNSDIQLSWVIGDSIVSEDFEIQRSTDGNLFETIGIKSLSDSVYYEYKDSEVKGFYPVLYYRLRQKRVDLFALYSETISIENVNLSAPVPVIFPNPTSEILVLDYTPEKGSWIMVRIADAAGRMIYQSARINNPRQPQFNIADLPKGRYYMLIVSQNAVYTLSWVKP